MIGWTEKEIFTKEFLKLDYHHILHEIKKNGFFCFDKDKFVLMRNNHCFQVLCHQ